MFNLKDYKLLLFLLLAFSIDGLGQKTGGSSKKEDPNLKLWYDTPASVWEEALPLGNGKSGAMVFGRINKERFQLNDNTLWSGYPNSGDNPNGPALLPKVRQAIFEGDYNKATSLWRQMQGPYSARYLPLGDLILNFNLKDSASTFFQRELNLNNAVSTTRYKTGDVTYTRECFISYPDKIMAIRITADKKGTVSFRADLSSKLRYKTSSSGPDYLILKGKAPKYVANRPNEAYQVLYDENAEGEGMAFEIHLKVKTNGGTIANADSSLVINNANNVTLYLSEATSFNGFDKSPGFEGKDPSIEARENLNNAFSKSFESLKANHIDDYQSLFKRVELDLGSQPGTINLPTNKRLLNVSSGKADDQLTSLYYQYGRYLLIASSRPGSRPANLQGIWNDQVTPPWGSNYTTNINTEMNYWLAENANLSECHQPLFDFMEELAVNGAKTAKINYNIDHGWVTHHNSDLWAKTSPPGGYDLDPRGMPRWSAWPMAGAWLSTHLWEHYLYTGDKDFLKQKAYPLMKGAAEFMLQWLIKDPVSGYLITNPSTSPENTIKIEGKEYQMTMASTMDMAIIRELFTACIRSSEILGIDQELKGKLEQGKQKLFPYQIGQFGQLQEWYKDWDDPQDKHRHISHLFGLYPGNQISIFRNPELASATRQSLIHRGDVSTGWSMAWKINWWARLYDGNHANKILKAAFTFVDPTVVKEQMSGGGTYPNLFDAHPPFQIDGNFGATAGITEMLMQSHTGEISLLPALPEEWRKGSIKGIRSRGNYKLDINWDKGQLTKAIIYSGSGGNCRLRTTIPVKVLGTISKKAEGDNPNCLNVITEQLPFKKSEKVELQSVSLPNSYVIDFETQKEKTYIVVPL
jgi:alpha-L-fucosidase 2